MIYSQVWVILLSAFLIGGIIVYFGYKYIYERNLNRALNKQKSWNLPRMGTILIIYVVVCVLGLTMGMEKKEACIQDQYSPVILYEGEDKILNDQVSQWMMSQNNAGLTKTDLKDNFEGIIGQAEDGNFAMFVTYRVHGIEADDELTMTVTSMADGVESKWTNKQPLKNGMKVYAFSFASITDVTCSQASFQFDIEVKGHPELAVTKKVKIMFNENSTISVIE